MLDIFPDHIIIPPRGIGAAVIFLTKPSAVATNALVGSVVAVVIVPIVNCSFIVRPVLVSTFVPIPTLPAELILILSLDVLMAERELATVVV